MGEGYYTQKMGSEGATPEYEKHNFNLNIVTGQFRQPQRSTGLVRIRTSYAGIDALLRFGRLDRMGDWVNKIVP